MAVSNGSRSCRTRNAITSSSSEALPARSPMPLIVHSICRTPPWTAAMLLATASPRSSWQCVLKTALSAFGTRRADLLEELADVLGRRVADRVGQVDRRRAMLDGGLDDAAQEVAVAARRILRRELHIVGVAAREADAVHDLLETGLARDAQLALEVEVRGGEEGVNAAAFRGLERPGGFVDVGLAAAGERGDDRPPDFRRDLPGRFRVGRRGDREAGLDDVHAQRIERARHAQLRRHVHREARRLLAVAQRGVEHDDTRGFGSWRQL